MQDLDRFSWKDGAWAICDQAGSACFLIEHKSSGTTGTQAREHTRKTGHKTRVYHRHVTEYRRG